MLDLEPFNNAIAQLKCALDDYENHPEIITVKIGVIKCFEFTYDLAQKMMRRFLMETEASADEFEDMPLPDIVRRVSDLGLTLHGWKQWADYRKSRNITSHTYDRAKADEVFATVPAFYEDVTFVYKRMAEALSA